MGSVLHTGAQDFILKKSKEILPLFWNNAWSIISVGAGSSVLKLQSFSVTIVSQMLNLKQFQSFSGLLFFFFPEPSMLSERLLLWKHF